MSDVKNKKIAICTLYDMSNVGNRLQNYAVSIFFEEMGFNTVTIPDKRQSKVVYKNPMQWIKMLIHRILQFMGLERGKKRLRERFKERCLYMESFDNQYICTSSPINYHHLNKKFENEFDYYVTGSDQVWHCWKNDRKELEYFFLMFADSSKRITIAPSFGFDNFPEKYLSTYKKGLEGFEYLSVREERGAELIHELTGKEATVLLDPTMLIETSEWIRILKKPLHFVNVEYIFVYSLDGFKGEIKEKAEKLASDMKMQIVDIMDCTSVYYTNTRPDEFLYWIYNAELIITDSFHASVFSILFNKPFVVVERTGIPGMRSRLDTLFEKFGIEDRTFETCKSKFDNEKEWEKLFSHDYSHVSAILKEERHKAREFYKKCFHCDL